MPQVYLSWRLWDTSWTDDTEFLSLCICSICCQFGWGDGGGASDCRFIRLLCGSWICTLFNDNQHGQCTDSRGNLAGESAILMQISSFCSLNFVIRSSWLFLHYAWLPLSVWWVDCQKMHMFTNVQLSEVTPMTVQTVRSCCLLFSFTFFPVHNQL